MLNEVGVKIKFVRSKNAFCVMGNGKAVITHASLFVRKVKIMPSVFWLTLRPWNAVLQNIP